MPPASRPSRWAVSGLALCLVVGLAACGSPRAEGPVRAKRPDTGTGVRANDENALGEGVEPQPQGPQPSWSATARRVDQPLAQVGRVIVVPDERELRGVDRATGRELWRHPFPTRYQYAVAGELIVASANSGGAVEALDAATGVTRWRGEEMLDVVVYQQAVHYRECVGAEQSATCVIAARDVRDGHRLWKLPADRFARISDVRIGARTPYALATEPYVSVRRGVSDQNFIAVSARTGTVGGGRLPNRAWYGFVAGGLLVTTDNDPPRGDRRCTVALATADAATGKRGWSGAVFSGRTEDGKCGKLLAHRHSGMSLLGAGTRLVAVTATGRPQLVELRTGQAVWQSTVSGVPIDGDDRSVLVRRSADEGELTLLDMATGAPRWTAPDPGLSGRSASWRSTVTPRLVAVSGVTEEQPFVVVYDARAGRELGRYPGWFAGAGDDWVAVSRRDSAGAVAVNLHTF